MGSLEERNPSYWISSGEETSYPPLEPDHTCDVLVIGGGITGLTTAYLLARERADVTMIEAGSICSGTTGYTTGKITSQHGLVYADLIRRHGEGRARLYADAQETGISLIESIVYDESIACDFARMPAQVYTEQRDMVVQLEGETEAARRLGLPADYRDTTDLPFAVAGAVRFDAQALFHPRRYCLGLARAIERHGGRIFEQTRATDVAGDGPFVVETTRGTVRASTVVVATLMPFLKEGLFFARTEPVRSYVIAAPYEQLPGSMSISAEQPTRSIRPHPGSDGRVLLIGGGGHPVGRERETERYYDDLQDWASARFGLGAPTWRWSAQDFVPADGVPYVGPISSSTPSVLIATGFKKWGITNGTAAAVLFADLIAGRENPWVELFDPTRIKPLRSAATVASQGLETAKGWIADRLGSPDRDAVDALPRGQGGVVKADDEQIAVYRDDAGRLHAVSATCTHLACIVEFNEAERTWDCPCHGSRFATDGRVLNGPATEDLPPR